MITSTSVNLPEVWVGGSLLCSACVVLVKIRWPDKANVSRTHDVNPLMSGVWPRGGMISPTMAESSKSFDLLDSQQIN